MPLGNAGIDRDILHGSAFQNSMHVLHGQALQTSMHMLMSSGGSHAVGQSEAVAGWEISHPGLCHLQRQ